MELCVTKGVFQPWSWRKNCLWPKGLFNLDLDERIVYDQRGFSTTILTKGNQRAFQPWNRSCLWPGGFSTQRNCLQPRGFSTSILTKEMSMTKGAFPPQSWQKIIKGLFNLETRLVCDQGALQYQSWWRNYLRLRGFSTSILTKELSIAKGFSTSILTKGLSVTKGLFNLNLDER